MKKVIILSISVILISGCGSRKSTVSKSTKVSETSMQQDISVLKNKDSTGSKKTVEQEQKSIKLDVSSWKYTAPAQGLFPCVDSSVLKPFYMLTAAGDSIDVSGLPFGSTLETNSDKSSINQSLSKTVDEQAKIIEALQLELSHKEEQKSVEVEKLKEVEKQTLQWYLVCAALILGHFMPSIYKWAFRVVKKIINPTI